MNLSLSELQDLLHNISESQLSNKNELIRALQNEIAAQHLEVHLEGSLVAELRQLEFKVLDNWVNSFVETGLSVPKELWQVREEKLQRRSAAYLWELIKEHQQGKQ
jgi:hypothetical protein